MRTLQATFLLALGTGAALAETCHVTEKCGASGMCVAADEVLHIQRDRGAINVTGVPAPQGTDTFRIASDGRFVWRPAHADTHAPGVEVDQMAASFAGTCTGADE